jgi:hypothetical protein
LRETVDGVVRQFDISADACLLDENFHRAYMLMSSARMREASDLNQELEATRDRYGHNRFGQSCPLARCLIERGVRY